jgi:uncharacterized protein (DUF1810 family)
MRKVNRLVGPAGASTLGGSLAGAFTSRPWLVALSVAAQWLLTFATLGPDLLIAWTDAVHHARRTGSYEGTARPGRRVHLRHRMTDRFDLERFVVAQDERGMYDQALAELTVGAKAHWMWFVFPQVAGLGRSPMAQRYAIEGLEEARAYLAHPVLGPRLREAAEAMLGNAGVRSAEAALGGIDAMKLRSSMTLFARAAAAASDDTTIYRDVLATFYDGDEDPATLERLGL